MNTETLERRLEHGLQRIASTTPVRRPGVFDPSVVALLDASPASHRRLPYLAGAAAVGLLSAGIVAAAVRSSGGERRPAGTTDSVDGGPTSPITVDTRVSTTVAATATAPGTAMVDDTMVPGAVRTPLCEAPNSDGPFATLYLGGPASDLNLARPGFIYSMAEGTEPGVVVADFIGTSVTGGDCDVLASPSILDGTFDVFVVSPRLPATLQVEVDTADRDGAIGVTAVRGSSTYTLEPAKAGQAPTIKLGGKIPGNAARVDVRFKKGDDMWSLSAEPVAGEITLAVPPGETDPSPDAAVDWVLLTLLDANGAVVDVVGGVLTHP